jgi:peptide deformylase
MSILKVTRLGHPVLRKVTETISVKDLKTPAMQKFIDDMVETMKEYDGVGLAADQVFTSKQVAVLEVANNPRYPNKGKVPLTVLVNPKITPLSDEMDEDWEGCRIPISRPVRAVNPFGQALDRHGLDFVAKNFRA